MSTWFGPRYSTKIRFADVFDGRLAPHGITEEVNEDTTENSRCLTDGNNWLWVFLDASTEWASFKRYAPNGCPDLILAAIEQAFDTNIYSEYEPQFWGFDTQEEWDAWKDALASGEVKVLH